MADTEDVIVNRDYSDNFSIKESALSILGSKYFENIELSGLNVGLLGFTMEQIANITEDAFNTSSVLINEAFPNRAIIPESIYSHAAIFQIDSTFRSCAKCSFIMLLQQDEILEHGETSGNKTTLYIDKNTVIAVKDIPFTLDYDIKIEAQKTQLSGSDVEYNFSAQYVMDTENCISDVNDPYLKIRRVGSGNVILQFTAHQVERSELHDTITSNTKVNYPVLNFDFEGGLAGFDIFYKAPTASNWTQLEKRIMFSSPVKRPFCYYRLKDENTLTISFSSRDGYFQPDFNSEVKIIIYTTLGTGGNFSSYNGTDYEISPVTDTYEYNDKLSMAVKTVSESSGGTDGMTLEALQALTVESYSSATEISNENDILTYFYNFKYRYGNEMIVIKRRDDTVERLFSAFLLIKNNEYIYPTNTLNLDITQDQFDAVGDSGRYSLQPGHLFRYKAGSTNTVELIPDIMCWETEKVAECMESEDFVYTNPFLISMNKTPNLIGLYQTVVNQTAVLDFVSSDSDSFMQFVSSKITLSRGLNGTPEYKLSMSIAPSSSMDDYVKNLNSYEGNSVRIIAGIIGNSGIEVGYIELLPSAIDPDDTTTVTYEATLKSDDFVTSNGLFSITNVVIPNSKNTTAYVPISDVTINVYILYDDGLTERNKFMDTFPDMKYFRLCNTYNTKSDPLTFIEPLNMMRSTVLFTNIGTTEDPIVSANISLLPMIKADILSDEDNFNEFVSRFTANYTYLEECLPTLRNNTNLDIKFFNTYGKSSNYFIGDDEELIDTINIKIKFRVVLQEGTDEIDISQKLKTFIKEFIEQLNSDGSNDLYISNLIKAIENQFAEVHHLKFMGINNYSTDYQTIIVKETDLNNLTKEERQKYVPEMLVVDSSNILLDIETL
jgi:hypothetical protein